MRQEDIAYVLNSLNLSSAEGCHFFPTDTEWRNFSSSAKNCISIGTAYKGWLEDEPKAQSEAQNVARQKDKLIAELKEQHLLKPGNESQIITNIDVDHRHYTIDIPVSVLDETKLLTKVEPVNKVRLAIRDIKKDAEKDPALKLMAAYMLLGANNKVDATTALANLIRNVEEQHAGRMEFLQAATPKTMMSK